MIPLLSALALACERPPRAPALGFFPFPSPMLLGSKTVGSGWDGLPHRYWRVHSTANGGASQTAILELEMYESEFGADVCTGGTAFASSEVTSGGTFSASRGFDGSLSDFVGSVSTELCWAGNTTNEWLAYDFGAGVTKSVVAIGMHARQSSFVTQVPTTFSVDFSDDGSTWTQAWSVTGISWGGFEFKRFVNPSWSEPSYTGSPFGAHVYWRAYFQTTVSGGTTAPSIAEIENHATPGGTDQSNSGTAAASSIFSGSFPASNAYDNNASTLWSAASGAGQDGSGISIRRPSNPRN